VCVSWFEISPYSDMYHQ